jgi:transcriptional regulator with XRE-family HTH domain
MSVAALRAALDQFGLTQIELAELLSVTPRTVSLWATGETQVPGPVLAYLRVLSRLGPEALSGEFASLDRRKLMIENGLYKIDFTGNQGWGDGILILQNGIIAGHDVGDVQYDGRYSFNGKSSTNTLELTIAVPPHGELVTGFVAGPAGAKIPVVAECGRPAPECEFVAFVGGKKVLGKIRKLRAL